MKIHNTDHFNNYTDFLARNPKISGVLQRSNHVGRTGRKVTTASQSTNNNLRLLYGLCADLNPTHTLEIGMAAGASTLIFGGHHKESGNAGKHITIDPFQSNLWDYAGVMNCKEAEVDAHYELLEEFSAFALPELLQENKTVDLAYVDGSHIFEDVFVDFYFLARMLTDKGVVIFDDCSDRHVAKVIRFIDKNMHSHFKRFPLDCYVTTRFKMRRRIGSFLKRVQAIAFQKVGGNGVRQWNSSFQNF